MRASSLKIIIIILIMPLLSPRSPYMRFQELFPRSFRSPISRISLIKLVNRLLDIVLEVVFILTEIRIIVCVSYSCRRVVDSLES